MNLSPERLETAKRFGRSSIVGIVATIVDYAVLEVLVRAGHMDATHAKVISLALGVTTQFVGSRTFAFRAQRGRLRRQLKWFLLCEATAFALTCGVFRLSVRYLQMPLEVANAIAGVIVYWGFSYPIWKRVFTVLPEDAAVESQPPAARPSLV